MNIETIRELLSVIPMNGFASFFIGLFFLVLFFLLYKANRDERLDWSDLITYKGHDKVSLSKCLQLVGGVTATWIMIYMTLSGKLGWDMFTAYLAYVGAVEGYSKYLSARYNIGGTPGAKGGEAKPSGSAKPKDPEDE